MNDFTQPLAVFSFEQTAANATKRSVRKQSFVGIRFWPIAAVRRQQPTCMFTTLIGHNTEVHHF